MLRKKTLLKISIEKYSNLEWENNGKLLFFCLLYVGENATRDIFLACFVYKFKWGNESQRTQQKQKTVAAITIIFN